MQDITYLPCLEGMLYLNTIMDLFNAEIVAYAISRHPDTRLCLDSLQMLVDVLGGNVKGIILHSDCQPDGRRAALRTPPTPTGRASRSWTSG